MDSTGARSSARILGKSVEKRHELYKGKAKTVYATDDPRYLVMHYRDDVSAFDGAKLAKLELKGETNNKINAYVMGKLAAARIATHFVRLLNERESLVKAMKMIPVECVVRNICAGSMAKRYGIDEGTRLPEPIFEFFLKSDALHDPLVNYKLEFGHPIDDPNGALVLGDEFTPDGCRLWDAKSGDKLDKDRFRRDLGSVIEHYREVARRIGAPL